MVWRIKEDYISIDTRLEYMETIAVKYVPDVDMEPSIHRRKIRPVALPPPIFAGDAIRMNYMVISHTKII